MSEAIHELDGAYVLGALAPDERRRFEEHLTGCAACTRSLQDLAGLPGVLGRLDEAEARSLRDAPAALDARSDGRGADRAVGVARRVRRARVRRGLVLAAVAAALVVLGAAGGRLATTGSSTEPRLAAVHVLRPVGGSHLTARLQVTPVGWGTRFDWSCDYRGDPAADGGPSYRATPTSYSLVVHTDAGATATVATWTSDAGEAHGLVAASAIPAAAIDSVDIRVTGSSTALALTRY